MRLAMSLLMAASAGPHIACPLSTLGREAGCLSLCACVNHCPRAGKHHAPCSRPHHWTACQHQGQHAARNISSDLPGRPPHTWAGQQSLFI